MTKPKAKAAASRLPATLPAVEDVEDMLSAAGDATHKLYYYRQQPGGGAWDYLGAVSVGDVREPGIREYTRARWGGGHFKAKLRHTNGQWVYSRVFDIEGDPKRATHTDPKNEPRREREETPWWVPIAVTAATTFAAAIAKKMMDDPRTDPALLELIKRSGRGESIDPIQFQHAIITAEQRGEARGRELGEMKAQLESGGDSAVSSSGVVAAIREAAGAAKDVVAYARNSNSQNPPPSTPPMRVVRPPIAPASPAAEDGSAVSPSSPASGPVPAYLHPIVAEKARLLWAMDTRIPADSIVNAIINKADDEQLAALFASHDAGRFRDELTAAIPEVAELARHKALEELLEEIARAVQELRTADQQAVEE